MKEIPIIQKQVTMSSHFFYIRSLSSLSSSFHFLESSYI